MGVIKQSCTGNQISIRLMVGARGIEPLALLAHLVFVGWKSLGASRLEVCRVYQFRHAPESTNTIM